MKYLVTGSTGHLGEGLVRTLQKRGDDYVSIDIKPSPFTTHVGSVYDRDLVRRAMQDVDVVFHCATLHKPHIVTHSKQDFIDCNISGTLTLLEEAVAQKVQSFIFTSTTSIFGRILTPDPGAPAVWLTEKLVPVPKNVYGITKLAAENLCEQIHKDHGLPVLILRTSRFFPEDDDNKAVRSQFSNENAKINEFLNRRGDIEDMVSAHLVAARKAPDIGFDRFIISATSPFQFDDRMALTKNMPDILRAITPYEKVYAERGWQMPETIGRVYVNDHARNALGWEPKHSFASTLERVKNGGQVASDLAIAIGKKGYHEQVFEEGPYPVDPE